MMHQLDRLMRDQVARAGVPLRKPRISVIPTTSAVHNFKILGSHSGTLEDWMSTPSREVVVLVFPNPNF
jgi:hypothetical protein